MMELQHLADALSTVTILSCLFLKVPQIMSIRERKSADGIYLQALLMEITGFSIMTLYNFTNKYGLMTYLEYPIILLQIYVLTYYVMKFKRIIGSAMVSSGVIIYFATVTSFLLDILPKHFLSYLVPFCTPLSGFAKITYILGMVNAGNANAVSLTTWIISVSTNLARVFTVYMDSGDIKLITNFVISALLSMGVLCTAIHYQYKRVPQQQTRKKSLTTHRHKYD